MFQRWVCLLSSLALGLLAALVLLGGTAVRAGVVCVMPGAGTPIGDALAAAQAGDVIRVAGGEYSENLLIDKTVTLGGGWNAGCTARDLAANPTTIRPADNTQSVVWIDGEMADPAAVAPTLDGFIITGGRAELDSNHGGGLKIRDSNAIVSNNVISGNSAYFLGGGVWVQRGAPTLQDNRIQNNSLPEGSGSGGGVALEGTAATLIGNVISDNGIVYYEGYGGGVAILGGGPVTLRDNTISNNAANMVIDKKSSSPTVGRGGGVALNDTTAVLSDNIIENNVASVPWTGFGGGIYILNSDAGLRNNIIHSNVGSGYGRGSGGGLRIEDSSVELDGDRIEANVASEATSGFSGFVGGLSALRSDVSLQSVWIIANEENEVAGGGWWFVDSSFELISSIVAANQAPSSSTGGLAALDSSGTILSTTFADNSGRAIYVSLTELTVRNAIFVGHDVAAIQSSGSEPPLDVTYSDFYDNGDNDAGFTLDPATNLFVDPELTDDYHLSANSPLINAGNGTVPGEDIDGEPRMMAGQGSLYRIDIGADEYPGAAPVIHDLSQQPADFTLIGPGGPKENLNAMGTNDWMGSAVLGGDVNGDGRDDLVAGARTHTDEEGAINDSGRVYALYNNGSRRTGVYDLLDQPASLEVRSYLHQQHIGFSFTAADLNGNGPSDLIVGSVGGMNGNEPVTGTVYAFAGGASLTGVKTLSPTVQADWRFKSGESTQTFSALGALAAGQLNGSGPADLAVGELLATGPGNRASAGAVYLFFGRSNLPALWDLADTPASLTIYGPAADAELGLVAVGDVDGDGQSDLVARSGSAAYVFYGPLAGGVIDLDTATADAAITGLDFGPLAVGDVDGNGQNEILLGNGDEVVVVEGGVLPASQSINAAAWARFTGLESPSSFVQLGALDWTGDGRQEVVVGDAQVDKVYVIFGGETGTYGVTAAIYERADWQILGEADGDQFGFSLGSGDLDDDGKQDLIIGSRSHDVEAHPGVFDDAGAVYVFYGSSSPPAPGGGLVYLPVVER